MPILKSRARRARPLVHLADRIFNRPLCVTRAKADQIMAALAPHLGVDASLMLALDPDDFDQEQDDDRAYSVDQNGIACVPIIGTLVKRTTGMDAASGLTSYESVAKQLAAAVADPKVRAILLDTDSAGGEVDGLFECADAIYSMRGTKPIYSLIDGQGCSAAYCLASAADRVYITRTGMAGSIGCYMLHCDQSGYDKEHGLRYTYISAGKRKTEGNPHEALTSAAEKSLQQEVDRIRNLFCETVSSHRGRPAKTYLDTEGAIYFAGDAVPLLADRVVQSRAEVHAALAAAAPSTSITVPVPSLPAARVRQLLPAAAASALDWLASRSNLRVDASFTSVAERLRAEESTVRARLGQAVEARVLQFPKAYSSAAPVGRKISMLVAPYGVATQLAPGIYEQFAPGAFAAGLGDDPRALQQHDDSRVIGRTSAGTAKFWEESDGLHGEATGPDAVWFADLLASMRRRDVDQASAGFFVLESQWEMIKGQKTRVIRRALLRDGSVVSRGAYSSTAASVEPEDSLAAAADRLRILRLR